MIARRRTTPKADLEQTCRVYFIEAVGTGLVKIGYAGNVDSRLTALLTASAHPLKLLGTMKGGPILEGELHLQLAEHRSHGEWFRRCDRLDSILLDADLPKEAPEYLAKMRGSQLMSYMNLLRMGKITRPTRGPAKRMRLPGVNRYAWSADDPFRKEP